MTQSSRFTADDASHSPLSCPGCKNSGRIDIAALVWVRQTPDGTDPDASEDQSHDWDDGSQCVCRCCGHTGTVEQFRIST